MSSRTGRQTGAEREIFYSMPLLQQSRALQAWRLPCIRATSQEACGSGGGYFTFLISHCLISSNRNSPVLTEITISYFSSSVATMALLPSIIINSINT